jgi:hypothetical protein
MRYLLFFALLYISASVCGAEVHKTGRILPKERVQEFIMLAKQLPACGDILFASIARELTASYPDITRKELASLFVQTDKKSGLRASAFELPMLQKIWHHIEKEKTRILINIIFPTTIEPEVYSYNFVSDSWRDKSHILPQPNVGGMQTCLSNSIYIKFHQLHQYLQKLLITSSFVCHQHIYIGQLASIADFSVIGTTLERTRADSSDHSHILLLFYGSDFAHVILADEHNVFVFQHIRFIIHQTDEKILLGTIQEAVEHKQEIRFESILTALDYVRSLAQ